MRNMVEHGQMSGSSETTVVSGCSASRRCTRWISVPTPMTDPEGGVDGLDDEVGRSDLVGQLADLAAALGVGHHDAVRVLGPERLDVLGPEALVDGAVAPPQEEGGLLAVGFGEPAQLEPRVPHPHVDLGKPMAWARCSGRGAGRGRTAPCRRPPPTPPPPPSLPSAHSSTARALVDVHTRRRGGPRRPSAPPMSSCT